MKKRLIRITSIIIVITLLIGIVPTYVFANEKKIEPKTDESKTLSLGEVGGYLAGSLKTTKSLYANRKFSLLTGHGYAFENANSLYDSLKGVNSKVIGDNNAKNGADRVIFNKNGTTTLIQDKCYSTAKRSVLLSVLFNIKIILKNHKRGSDLTEPRLRFWLRHNKSFILSFLVWTSGINCDSVPC